MTTTLPHNSTHLHPLIQLVPLHMLGQTVSQVALPIHLHDGQLALRHAVLDPQLSHLNVSSSPCTSPSSNALRRIRDRIHLCLHFNSQILLEALHAQANRDRLGNAVKLRLSKSKCYHVLRLAVSLDSVVPEHHDIS